MLRNPCRHVKADALQVPGPKSQSPRSEPDVGPGSWDLRPGTYNLPDGVLVPISPNGSHPPHKKDSDGMREDEGSPEPHLVKASRRRTYRWVFDKYRKAVEPFRQLIQPPVKFDVLADVDRRIVAPQLAESLTSAELNRTLPHLQKAAPELKHAQVDSRPLAPLEILVLDGDASAD